MQYVAIGVRCLIGVVFLASSVSKVIGRDAFGAFVASLQGMKILPSIFVRLAAYLVIGAEFSTCVTLAIPGQLFAMIGFAAAAILFTLFIAGISLSLRRGIHAPCRCFGASVIPLGSRHIVRNVGLVAVVVVGVLTALSGGSVDVSGAVVAMFAGLLLGGMAIIIDDVLGLFLPINGPSNPVRTGR
ncbi:MauE/DoxX family redox-associated membrane protein [Actinoallomurus sp. NPDC052274]|uniref:MauE/DoxX family redox-associated membrane protein n=1 Tax=Actinoallomurus sp. NPDC052274 TaxID=3155420 RepID=UPI003438B5AC